jgi:hypothetical protein
MQKEDLEVVDKLEIAKKAVSAYLGVTLYYLKLKGVKVDEKRMYRYLQEGMELEYCLKNDENFADKYEFFKKELFEKMVDGERKVEEVTKVKEMAKVLNNIANKYTTSLSQRVKIQSNL